MAGVVASWPKRWPTCTAGFVHTRLTADHVLLDPEADPWSAAWGRRATEPMLARG
ncbi:MAG: hypothetical protein WKF43_10525 [Acidimicrobiales bacterium]